ncbi:MAG TPA: DUF1343 domain-containing protein [Bacteroidales bacterium]|nr:DUF1343 domain-containing protein [Bacteroidales bacterium]HPJ58600.1 DUF1343 domain-containing protein [Bacteroidales bacterium]HPR11241.1 DUF1343 domain-containing protein [Bacteroidales bacterium]HRW86513.1 DUF1343 domain-containing protein [Bacteroidales bacterium]
MVRTGLDIITGKVPAAFKRKRIGILCHAPSVISNLTHITEIFSDMKDCSLTAIFGPQHGMFGETQDNMIEWEGFEHPYLHIPVFSLYGKTRRPLPSMLDHIDVLLVDLQDVGARLYTYIWTVKECMAACAVAGIPVWIADRPNPIGSVPYDGPVLKKEFFSFVGGASIPLCHRMTIGEMAMWIREKHIPDCDLNVIWMENWRRDTMFNRTGLPWIIPSPNMPTLQTAKVYPGTVLFEGMNVSEGRGTTIPFELLGAPWIDSRKLSDNLRKRSIKGCRFREHSFIPAFNKFSGQLCHGIQIHVTEPQYYQPVATALHIIDAIFETSPPGMTEFRIPPYEYEENLMPFDILSGDCGMRESLIQRLDPISEIERWNEEIEAFRKEFSAISIYAG